MIAFIELSGLKVKLNLFYSETKNTRNFKPINFSILEKLNPNL